MSLSVVAERYARALFELAEESGQLSAVTQQVRSLAQVYRSSRELASVLDNPLVPESQREAVLRAVSGRLGLGPLVLNTVRMLARRHRLGALPDLARELVKLADVRLGVVRATVTSPAPLSEVFCRRLTALLEEKTQRKVVLDQEVDPSLMGGVVTRISGYTIDGSIRGRLHALQRQLLATT